VAQTGRKRPTRKSKFPESQIVAILKEGEAGVPVAEACRKHGISSPTYYAWKSKYAVYRPSSSCPD
jgi:transposase-like protein